ncbi:hypothetical protein R6Q59_032756 [Mikania micrantha]|uniref:Uncharacterized protein n=1 Tax=Mikania micrantha TaxID=192012 RepID=A0A5N6NUN6_9ASTR|nr:hypothetical protein E3N88_17363 [Mikania micrantha]
MLTVFDLLEVIAKIKIQAPTIRSPSFSPVFEREFMANQSPVLLQNKLSRQAKHSKRITIGLSKSLINKGNKLSFSGNHDSQELKKMDSTRIHGSETINGNQEHERRCFEKLVAEIVDDTALIETTVVVTGFKNHYSIETDVGYRNHPRNTIVSRVPNQKSDGNKKKRGIKKHDERCSMKCMNEKKPTEKKITEKKCQKVHRNTSANGYQRKNTKNLKIIATGDKEHHKVKNPNALEKISGEVIQGTDVNLKIAIGIEEELTIKSVGSDTANEKDEGLKLNPVTVVHTQAQDQNVYENTTVGSKKTAYTREEIQALRSVDQEGQKSKWLKVYYGFSPTVAREYSALANNQQTQRYNRVVNCGSTLHANVIHSMPPVLPLCSPSNCK